MIPKQPFGRTGHMSTRTIFGAFALSRASQAQADRVLELLLEYGINHIDVAASYGDAELRVGPWMRRHRQDFFLATKTEKRTYQEAWEELHRSLELLQTDHVDLWQFHYLVKPEEWEVAMGPGGVLEAALEARAQGLIRFIGVTGHDVPIAEMHLRSLARFGFDSVLLPYNYLMMQNPEYAAKFEQLLALCREQKAAVQTIKSLARREWGDTPKQGNTWYHPLTEQADIDLAVHWVLSRPDLFLITAGDMDLLPKILDAAGRFEAGPSEAEMEAMASRLEMEPRFV
jgi:aryl-alcohol dehydrogenase-like predicted oxidoreductase